VKEEAFFFRTGPIPTSYNGVFGRRMPTYAVCGGWIISIIAGWFEVTADTYNDFISERARYGTA
jgi:hypothetical protein